MREKRHCCCCVPLPDGVMLVGIYGTAFHTGLLVIQLTHGASLAPEPHLLEPPFDVDAGEIVNSLLLASHLLGISVNALLLFGMYWGKRRLMLPWLFLQGFLASILASLACYYIALFPLKKSCLVEQPSTSSIIEEDEPNFRPIVSASTRFKVDGAEESGRRSTCQVLLWYGAIMILSILILVYYFYIVHDFLDQLKIEKKREKTQWQVDIELKESPPETPPPLPHSGIDEPDDIVVLEETIEPTTLTTSSSDATKQVTFDTTEEYIAPAPVSPKKTSRVAWQDDIEFIE